MNYIASFSGGKDSTAMILKCIENNYPLDEIITFDCGSWEFPAIREHILKFKKFIEETTDIKFTIVTNEHSFDYMLSELKMKKGVRKGKKGYGFPRPNARWCTTYKIKTINDYIAENYSEVIQYIGFAIDEKSRKRQKIIKEYIDKNKYNQKRLEFGPPNLKNINNINEKIIFPLIDINMTEQMALQYCYKCGWDFGGLYNFFDRVSCWCCPLQSKDEVYILIEKFPELWEKLKKMEELCKLNQIPYSSFKHDGDCITYEYKNEKRKYDEKCQDKLIDNNLEYFKSR